MAMSKKTKPDKVTHGRCKLTRVAGKFIASHIVPQALTEGAWNDQPLQQRAPNGRIIKRWTSWNDTELVIQEGEDILQELDDWAIKFFRERKLIWSSWETMTLEVPDHDLVYEGRGLRKLADVDGVRLRQFFLSLLWRAAATNLPEFGAVSLPEDDLEKLRLMVLHGDVKPLHFYPIALTQLSTRNWPHNFAAQRITKNEPVPDPTSGELIYGAVRQIDSYRFYFDGLVAHFDIDVSAEHVSERAPLYVGAADELAVLTVPSEGSRQMLQLWQGSGMKEPDPLTLEERWLDTPESRNGPDRLASDAMFEVFSPPSFATMGRDLHVSVALNYQTLLAKMDLIRNAWFTKVAPVEFYRRMGLLCIPTVARKHATMITQALFQPSSILNVQRASFRIYIAGEDPRRSYLCLSWRFTKALGATINWATLNDRKFPTLALNYKYENEWFERFKAQASALPG
jgi:hypothetical protein